MLYSQIIGEQFYNIKLTPGEYALVDGHFLAAAHHYYRSKLSHSQFHKDKMWQHVKRLVEVIQGGDFSNAVDSGTDGYCDLSSPDSWAFKNRLPHPEMFDSMCEDHRYLTGEEHPNDILLTQQAADQFEWQCAI